MKLPYQIKRYGRKPSLSARRVWIEIKSVDLQMSPYRVTLCEESVD